MCLVLCKARIYAQMLQRLFVLQIEEEGWEDVRRADECHQVRADGNGASALMQEDWIRGSFDNRHCADIDMSYMTS